MIYRMLVKKVHLWNLDSKGSIAKGEEIFEKGKKKKKTQKPRGFGKGCILLKQLYFYDFKKAFSKIEVWKFFLLYFFQTTIEVKTFPEMLLKSA